jgi:hypothetical protein
MKTKPDDLVEREEVLKLVRAYREKIRGDGQEESFRLACRLVDRLEGLPAYDPWHGPQEEPEEGRPCIFQSVRGFGTGVANAEGFVERDYTNVYFTSLSGGVIRWMYVPLPKEEETSP